MIVNENFRSSGDKFADQVHPDVIKVRNSTNGISNGKTKGEILNNNEPPPTSYVETLMHLFKGNVGPGSIAMADAVKNGGLILAPILTLLLGIICVHAQHVLLKCSAKMKQKYKLATDPDYAETVELCFQSSSSETWRGLAPTMKRTCNIFICVTQLGFCCIYFLFIGTNMKQVLDYYGFVLDIHVLVALILIPIWLSAMITNLKFLGKFNSLNNLSGFKSFILTAPCSGVANVCMITGIIICYYYSAQDLPSISERNFLPPNFHSLPLFFGTAIFAFEGIALVLPLQNAMKRPKNFSRFLGVLNVGMVFVTGIFISFGAIG